MVPWFICDCSAAQSAVCLSKCLAAAPIFLLGATRHFVLLSCKICAEIVVYRMLAVFLNGLNGKTSSRNIVRNIFSVYFFHSVFKISYSEYSFVTQTVISVIRIVSYISERPLTKPGSDCLDRIGSDSGSDRIGLRIGLVSSLLVQKNYFDKSCFNNDTGGSE